MNSARRIAVAVSGGGRTLRNFLANEVPHTGYQIAAVVASRADCAGADLARDYALPLFVGDFSAATNAATGTRLYTWLATHDLSWIALAGFLKVFPLHPDYRGRIVNIHPSLLPDFGGHGMYGDRVHAAVIAAARPASGATVHFVDGPYDEGRIVAQTTVPVLANDTPQLLAARVFAAECKLYPDVLNRLIAGSLPLPGRACHKVTHDCG